MIEDGDREITMAVGPAAPPRKNGELVFQRPWEGRAFGMALAMREHQPYRWDEFRQLLERRVREAGPGDDGSRYYERWVAAFEELLGGRGLVSPEEVDRRSHEYLSGLREEVF